MALKFQWVRPKNYAESPQSLGEHLRKRRILAGRTQEHVATELGVNTWTYLLWETDKTTPTVRYYPTIFRFLGYDPFPPAISLPAQIAAKRRELGLSIKEAAKRICVDEGTFGRWESGEWKPRKSKRAVLEFLALSDQAPR